jgi:hypothetical protein
MHIGAGPCRRTRARYERQVWLRSKNYSVIWGEGGKNVEENIVVKYTTRGISL